MLELLVGDDDGARGTGSRRKKEGEVVASTGWIERDVAMGISKACWAWPNGRETWA